jgi:hypothetical protein
MPSEVPCGTATRIPVITKPRNSVDPIFFIIFELPNYSVQVGQTVLPPLIERTSCAVTFCFYGISTDGSPVTSGLAVKGMVTPRQYWRKPTRTVAIVSRSALPSKLNCGHSARSEFEVDANRFDQALRVQFPRPKGRLQPISNRLPLFLVLDGKR